MLAGWPAPEMAHMKKNEIAMLNGKNPSTLRASGPGPET